MVIKISYIKLEKHACAVWWIWMHIYLLHLLPVSLSESKDGLQNKPIQSESREQKTSSKQWKRTWDCSIRKQQVRDLQKTCRRENFPFCFLPLLCLFSYSSIPVTLSGLQSRHLSSTAISHFPSPPPNQDISSQNTTPTNLTKDLGAVVGWLKHSHLWVNRSKTAEVTGVWISVAGQRWHSFGMPTPRSWPYAS